MFRDPGLVHINKPIPDQIVQLKGSVAPGSFSPQKTPQATASLLKRSGASKMTPVKNSYYLHTGIGQNSQNTNNSNFGSPAIFGGSGELRRVPGAPPSQVVSSLGPSGMGRKPSDLNSELLASGVIPPHNSEAVTSGEEGGRRSLLIGMGARKGSRGPNLSSSLRNLKNRNFRRPVAVVDGKRSLVALGRPSLVSSSPVNVKKIEIDARSRPTYINSPGPIERVLRPNQVNNLEQRRSTQGPINPIDLSKPKKTPQNERKGPNERYGFKKQLGGPRKFRSRSLQNYAFSHHKRSASEGQSPNTPQNRPKTPKKGSIQAENRVSRFSAIQAIPPPQRGKEAPRVVQRTSNTSNSPQNGLKRPSVAVRESVVRNLKSGVRVPRNRRVKTRSHSFDPRGGFAIFSGPPSPQKPLQRGSGLHQRNLSNLDRRAILEHEMALRRQKRHPQVPVNFVRTSVRALNAPQIQPNFRRSETGQGSQVMRNRARPASMLNRLPKDPPNHQKTPQNRLKSKNRLESQKSNLSQTPPQKRTQWPLQARGGSVAAPTYILPDPVARKTEKVQKPLPPNLRLSTMRTPSPPPNTSVTSVPRHTSVTPLRSTIPPPRPVNISNILPKYNPGSNPIMIMNAMNEDLKEEVTSHRKERASGALIQPKKPKFVNFKFGENGSKRRKKGETEGARMSRESSNGGGGGRRSRGSPLNEKFGQRLKNLRRDSGGSRSRSSKPNVLMEAYGSRTSVESAPRGSKGGRRGHSSENPLKRSFSRNSQNSQTSEVAGSLEGSAHPRAPSNEPSIYDYKTKGQKSRKKKKLGNPLYRSFKNVLRSPEAEEALRRVKERQPGSPCTTDQPKNHQKRRSASRSAEKLSLVPRRVSHEPRSRSGSNGSQGHQKRSRMGRGTPERVSFPKTPHKIADRLSLGSKYRGSSWSKRRPPRPSNGAGRSEYDSNGDFSGSQRRENLDPGPGFDPFRAY